MQRRGPTAGWGALSRADTGRHMTDSNGNAVDYFIDRHLLDGLALGRIIVSAPDGGAPAVEPPALAFEAFLAAAANQPPAECSPDEVAFWLYSSGSTGMPKGVRHVHSSLRATADTYGEQVL